MYKVGYIVVFMLTFLTLDTKARAQDVHYDTLSYYERDENEAYWIDDCLEDGNCEPVAIQFIQEDIPVNAVNIEKIRFKIAEPGVFRTVLYSGGVTPDSINIVWEDSIIVSPHEIDNTDTNEVSPWKEIDFREYTQNLRLNFPIWFQIDIKTYSLGFSEKTIDADEQPQSFTAWLSDDTLIWYPTWGAEFICDLIISYSPSSSEEIPIIPSNYKLDNPYPNPFNPSTTIKYELPKSSDMVITIYDILGRNVWSHKESSKPAGYYSLLWNGLNQNGTQGASGVYLISLSTPEFRAVQKAVLIR